MFKSLLIYLFLFSIHTKLAN